MSSSTQCRSARRLVLTVVLAAAWPLSVRAQQVTVHADADTLRIKAPTFHFLQDDFFDRLKDGQSMRVDLELVILPKPKARPVVRHREAFLLSYDLWEERVAVTRAGASSPAVTHLTTAAAETWCIDQLRVPLSALRALGRDATFWIRLEYRVPESARTDDADDNDGITLRGLIEVLSERPRVRNTGDAVEAGPFSIPR